jgi:hypothetical protein
MMVNKLKFSMLEMEVESSDYLLIDHGYVKNIKEHAREVYDQYNEPDFDNLIFPKNGAAGMFLYFERQGVTECNIFYVKGTLRRNIHRRAHEEMHALHLSGNLGLFQQRLDERQLDIRLMECEDFYACTPSMTDLVANIGSLYALDIKGEDLSTIVIDSCPNYLKKSMMIYQKALSLRDCSN